MVASALKKIALQFVLGKSSLHEMHLNLGLVLSLERRLRLQERASDRSV